MLTDGMIQIFKSENVKIFNARKKKANQHKKP